MKIPWKGLMISALGMVLLMALTLTMNVYWVLKELKSIDTRPSQSLIEISRKLSSKSIDFDERRRVCISGTLKMYRDIR